MQISESIKKIRKNLGLTQDKFARQLGIKRSLIGAYEEGRAEPRLELLHAMAKLGGINVEQFLNNSFAKLVRPKSERPSNNIQLVPIKAAAGYLKGFGDEDSIKELPGFSLPMLSRGTYRAFEIQGESMLPLASGTVVVGEQVESVSDMRSGKTYVLVTKRDGIVYKRVFNYLNDNGKLFLVSDNPSYKPYSLQPEDILEAWQAKAYISIQFPDAEVKFNPALVLSKQKQ